MAMCESGYYAPGTEFRPDAPWNQVDPPEMEFDCSATVVLNKDTTILTDMVCWDGEDWELCEDVSKQDVFRDNYTDIPTLLAELVKYIDGELEGKPIHQRRWELQKMKESARGWMIIDEDYE